MFIGNGPGCFIRPGHAGISAQVAIRLEKAGVGKAETWLNLQTADDLAKARRIGIEDVRPPAA